MEEVELWIWPAWSFQIPADRRLGLAKALLKHVEGTALEKFPCSLHLRLLVREDNLPANQMYVTCPLSGRNIWRDVSDQFGLQKEEDICLSKCNLYNILWPMFSQFFNKVFFIYPLLVGPPDHLVVTDFSGVAGLPRGWPTLGEWSGPNVKMIQHDSTIFNEIPWGCTWHLDDFILEANKKSQASLATTAPWPLWSYNGPWEVRLARKSHDGHVENGGEATGAAADEAGLYGTRFFKRRNGRCLQTFLQPTRHFNTRWGVVWNLKAHLFGMIQSFHRRHICQTLPQKRYG